MKKRILHIVVLFLLLLPGSCDPGWMNPFSGPGPGDFPPDGTPIMMTIPFSSSDLYTVDVSTKAESSAIDESRIHDLYVMIFDNTNTGQVDLGNGVKSAKKIYGRYFSYKHLETLTNLNNEAKEGWYVDNKSIDAQSKQTTGAVKISTITCSQAILVVVANIENVVIQMDGIDEIDRLNAVQHFEELRSIKVGLEQDVVNRKDLFLMSGMLDTMKNQQGETVPLNTASMSWGSLPQNYSDFKVELVPVDAKVKFRVKVNPTNIKDVTPVYWQVFNTPNCCYLDSKYNGKQPPQDIRYFDSQKFYFEGMEQDGGDTYYTFCFYMMENRLGYRKKATEYYQRELRDKIDSGEPGYKGPGDPELGSNYVNNGDWEYAPEHGTYVQFDLVLTLSSTGMGGYQNIDPTLSVNHALTSDAIFTVHLGDFASSGSTNPDKLNNYETERGHSYIYTITVNNTTSIFAEVRNDEEIQAGQEGFLLLTDAEIINADCHYEYHQITFDYRQNMSQDKFSWYVKTPFSEGGPVIYHGTDEHGQDEITYLADGQTYMDGLTGKTAPELDYRWVMFGINKKEASGIYTSKRHKYPGIGHYDQNWRPGKSVAADVECDGDRSVPDLMDISQLILFIFAETEKETAHRQDASAPESAFIRDVSDDPTTAVIRVTAFIDEYYYEEHPLEHIVDPQLWRTFVNAQPREMHILSDAQSSRDRKSDVILSSHSIIQQSIQTIYNTNAADLQTLWGTEHIDENRKKTDGWAYWPGDLENGQSPTRGRYGNYNTDLGKWNGRLNSAYIWEFWSKDNASGVPMDQEWSRFLDYNVLNNVPELVEDYQGMAYSCLSRNRDNNGDGHVDRSEVRWYLAACNQLVGMWVGNESLSMDARLYTPNDGQWRAHILSSTDKRVCWSEEGGGATMYDKDYNNDECWADMREAAKGESVRCLRNIGTYNDGGTLKDISYAPYTQEIDHYFTKEGTDPAGPYTFYFDRLNLKSIRAYSEGELPYANQFNIANCVYLKFETQDRADNVGDTEADRFDKLNTINNPNKDQYPTNETINKEVTALGYNPYCPPGYRFPNHSEMVLMSLYLPNAYFDRDKNGTSYGETMYMPSRTYFDRGLFEKKVSPYMTDADITREQKKVGWGYSTNDHKLHCAQKTEKMKRSRCVRDIEMIGHIDGGIMMDSAEICPNDWAPVTFRFNSSGSAFVSAALKFCYTDREGVYHKRDIPLEKTPAGLEYTYTQNVVIPSLTSLGLTEADLDTDLKNMKFEITVRNAAKSMTFVKPVTLVSHLTKCSISLPSVSKPDKGMPVRINIGSRTSRSQLTELTLHWKDSDATTWNAWVLVEPNRYNAYSQDLYLKDIINRINPDAWETEANRYKEYVFYVTATCDDGTHYASETISNQLLWLNERPNADGAWSVYPDSGEYHQWNDPWWQVGTDPWTTPNNANTWYKTIPPAGESDNNNTPKQKLVISNTLPGKQIDSLNFSNEIDFIEADLDVSQCVFVRTIDGNLGNNDPKNRTVGLDNIFGFAEREADLNWKAPSLLCYYPAHTLKNGDNPAVDKLQLDALYNATAHTGPSSYCKLQVGQTGPNLNLKLMFDGFYWNGKRVTNYGSADWNTVVPTLVTGTNKTLWVGALEGKHYTRATYNFVRAVRKKGDMVTPCPRP